MFNIQYIWFICLMIYILMIFIKYIEIHPTPIPKNILVRSDLPSKTGPIVEKRFPQAIIIGAKKCSTSAICFMLNSHPNVVTPSSEINPQQQNQSCPETHFFGMKRFYQLGLEWYRQHMPESTRDQITIEKTPAYFIKKDALERIHSMNSSIKLVLSVRDPTERVISDYVHCLEQQPNKIIGNGTFVEQVFNAWGQVDPHKYIINPSLYEIHIRNVLKLFKRHQILLVDSKIMSINPLAVLKKLEKFLNIPQWFTSERLYFNETKMFYCINNQQSIKCLTKNKGRVHPKIGHDTISKLRRFFAPHNKIFYKLVGHDFGWATI